MFLGSLQGLASAASSRVSQLTTIAKGALCLPSLIANLPGTLNAVAGGIAAGIAGAAQAAIGAVTNLALSAISAQVAKVTGAINSVINTAIGLIATVAGAIGIINQFIKGLKGQVNDIMKFIGDKENCNFAAASLASCVVNQALSSLTPKSIQGISKGLVKIDDLGTSIASKISSPTGAVGGFMNKASSEMNRAASVISASRRI